MAVLISACIAFAICIVIFPRDFKTTDLSPIIFFLGVVVLGILCYVSKISILSQLTKGPGSVAVIGAGMMFVMFASGTNTIKVLKKIPASAYKAIAPMAISVGVLLMLALMAIL